MHKQMMVGLQFLGYMGKWIHHQKIMELSETIRVKTLAAEATFQEELSMAETHYEKIEEGTLLDVYRRINSPSSRLPSWVE